MNMLSEPLSNGGHVARKLMEGQMRVLPRNSPLPTAPLPTAPLPPPPPPPPPRTRPPRPESVESGCVGPGSTAMQNPKWEGPAQGAVLMHAGGMFCPFCTSGMPCAFHQPDSVQLSDAEVAPWRFIPGYPTPNRTGRDLEETLYFDGGSMQQPGRWGRPPLQDQCVPSPLFLAVPPPLPIGLSTTQRYTEPDDAKSADDASTDAGESYVESVAADSVASEEWLNAARCARSGHGDAYWTSAPRLMTRHKGWSGAGTAMQAQCSIPEVGQILPSTLPFSRHRRWGAAEAR